MIRKLLAFAMLAVGLPGAVSAADFPTKPLKMIVPFAAGSGTDTMARTVAAALEKDLKQPVIVDNRPGGAAQIGAKVVATSDPDGYTFLFLGGGSLNRVFIKDLQVELLKELTPVVSLGRGGMSLIVSSDLGVNTLQEFVEYAKKNPGKLNFGYPTISQMLSMQLLKTRTGITGEMVSYKGGGEVLRAMVSGEIQATVDGRITFEPALQAGKVKILAHGDTTRSPGSPDVPTLSEAGVRDLIFPFTFGGWVPAATPRDVILRLNAAFNETLKDENVQARIRQSGGVPVGGAPEVHRQAIEKEWALWEEAAKAANYKPE
jgi:tripartite-type tricarboxylate transporter receptor subunit TctC